ncbi:hypothetical protein QZH41_008432 [Actinostola sp. cb2023]|nr:hypothetical protein QZH41_008432 [Actinostola sp. cb2023]
MEETAMLRCYGGGQSLSAWQRSRLAKSFETKGSAKRRREEVISNELEPNRKVVKKDHTGSIDNIEWDKKALKLEVEGFEDNHIINWKRLAVKYNVCNKAGQLACNGGQIVKEWLVSHGVNVTRFETKRKQSTDVSPIIRRKKRKGRGGEISVPTEVSPQKLKEQLKEKIKSGEYTVGEMIVPQKYEKLILTKDLKIEKIEFETEGRKTPLMDIRKNMLKKHKEYMRDHSDSYYNEMNEYDIKEKLKELNELPENKNNQPLDLEQIRKKLQTLERTRNLLVWLDNSTVANHGYLVCLVTCLYDPAVFYTDAEYRIKTGKTVNIQNIIEQPELHFIARCGSSDSELLLYSETRLACVQELKHDCAQYTDKLRFCHGDSPLRSFEAGQQKGGNYFCATCDVHCDMTYEIDHVLNKKPITLQARQDCILQGAVARRHSLQLKAKPLKALTKQQLEEELASRRIYEGKTKQELQDLLTREMHGMQRVPALIMNNPKANLKDIGLGDYEILPAEPLHDIGHHIENFLIEYPRHLSTAESTLLDETVELCIGGKDSKRCVDYRTTLVKTAGVAHQSGIMSKEALLAIDSLVEIQRILYSDEHNRSPALILRYYNQCWLHSMTLRNCIVKQPKKLTLRKMFGVYFHNLSSHAGLMLRIISGQAANAEGQERIFNHIKRITKHTSNYHPGQIIPNLFIRLQAEKEMGLQGDDAGRQQAHISKLAQCLPERSNTCIPISMIKKNSREWQAHLQQISDYLVEGEGVWWMKEDEMVEFYDVTKHPTQQQFGPQLHHFRSSNLQHEATHLDQCWAQCIDENVIIPTHLIRVDQDNGSTHKIFTDYLGDELPAATPEPEHVHTSRHCVT